ncbi:MAG TPA: hypothetical protein VKY73_07710, partial [Polyangiaceae bacterium]|nr:hypothetical protein [Polyangiaceae bacterium]
EEAETFEHNNIILQALGTAETVQVDLTYVDLRRGDILMLCSDGLSGMIRSDEIREVLTTIQDPLEMCRELTERANRAGGHDNITVIIGVFDGPGLLPPEAEGELTYQKYPLPENPSGHYPQAVTTGSSVSSYAEGGGGLQEAEPRGLRVGHTVMGLASPVAAGLAVTDEADTTRPPPDTTHSDEPVDLPTSGMAPSLVGIMVVGAMVLVAVAGILLLR